LKNFVEAGSGGYRFSGRTWLKASGWRLTAGQQIFY
jgi:hypothetical protein